MYSIIIPAYNEAASILQTIEKLRETLDKTALEYEIIVVNDGSKDETEAVAKSSGVTVFSHPSNKGYGSALKTGIVNARYDWCAIVDADGTYPIEQFPKLMEYIPAFDMVVAARTGEHYWGSFYKGLSRRFLGLLIRFVIGEKIPDANSGMRIFRKEIAVRHMKRISSGFSFTTTLTLAMFMEEHFVRYVEIDYFPRVGNSKVKLGIDSLRVLQILVSTILYYNPLKLFLAICILNLIIGVVGAAVALLFNFELAWLIFITALLSSILLGGIGFLAESIRLSRISSSALRQPQPRTDNPD